MQQATLAKFGFTKTILHRNGATKVEIPNFTGTIMYYNITLEDEKINYDDDTVDLHSLPRK